MSSTDINRTAQIAELIECIKAWRRDPADYNLPAMNLELDGKDCKDGFEFHQLMRRHHIPSQTKLPCPDFCTKGAGHPFDDDPEPLRTHTAELPGSGAASFSLEMDEFRDGSDDSTATLSAPLLFLAVEGNLKAADARKIAASLLNAADKLDALTAD